MKRIGLALLVLLLFSVSAVSFEPFIETEQGTIYTKTESWTGGSEKIRKELPTIRKMRKVDIWEERSGHSLVISS